MRATASPPRCPAAGPRHPCPGYQVHPALGALGAEHAGIHSHGILVYQSLCRMRIRLYLLLRAGYASVGGREAGQRGVGSGSVLQAELSKEGSLPRRPAAPLPPWEAFEKEILVKSGVAEVLGRTLKPARLAGQSLVIGTATDPYQPAERRF